MILHLSFTKDELYSALGAIGCSEEDSECCISAAEEVGYVRLTSGAGRTLSRTLVSCDIVDAGMAKATLETPFTVPGKKLRAHIRDTQRDSFVLNWNGSQAWTIAGGNLTGIPSVEVTQPVLTLTDTGDVMRNHRRLSWVLKAASTDTSRPGLNAVLFDVREGARVAIATDGHRLHLAPIEMQSVPIPPDGGKYPNAISVPAIMLERVAKFARKTQPITVALSDRNVVSLVCSNLGVFIDEPCLQGTFPPYEHVIPREGDALFQGEFVAGKLVQAVLKNHESVQFSVTDGKLGLAGMKEEVTGAPMELCSIGDAVVPGNARWRFNSLYLQEALSIAPHFPVRLSFYKKDGPLRIDHDGTISIVMPIRT